MSIAHEPELTDSLRKQAKAALRKRLSTLRRALPRQSVAERSGRIVAKLAEHALVRTARAIALFAAMPDRREVDLSGLHELLSARGVQLYYPFMDPIPSGYSTGFRLWRAGDTLEKRSQNFCEPDPSAPVAERGEVDLIIVPALGVTLQGHRLGFGAGFYDVTLPELCPPAKSLCVAFDFQLLVEIPVESHDFCCDTVVTDAP